MRRFVYRTETGPEYTGYVRTISNSASSEITGLADAAFLSWLNAFGAEGWELVHLDTKVTQDGILGPKKMAYVGLFKRAEGEALR